MEVAITKYRLASIQAVEYEQEHGVIFFNADDYKTDPSLDSLEDHQLTEDESQHMATMAANVRVQLRARAGGMRAEELKQRPHTSELPVGMPALTGPRRERARKNRSTGHGCWAMRLRIAIT